MTGKGNGDGFVPRSSKRIHWFWLCIGLLALVLISIALAYLLGYAANRINFPLDRFAWVACLTVFGTSLVANLTIVAPVPIAASIMLAAATMWNPALMAFCASVGASIGELSGYLAGYLGKRIAVPKGVIGYDKVEKWMQRYGVWAVMVLSFQPVIPFDVGGIIAGAARMPIHRFIPALWLGRFLKYLIMAYAGAGIISVLSA